jgi:hypothetical protein
MRRRLALDSGFAVCEEAKPESDAPERLFFWFSRRHPAQMGQQDFR